MQNVRTQTSPFPSWATIAAALLGILAAVVLVLAFSSQLGHQSLSMSSAPVVTKSAGSELAKHNASERGVVPVAEPDRAQLSGPR